MVILQAETVVNVYEITGVKKLEGFRSYYRIRVGNYRIGLEVRNDELCFIIIADRKDIYRSFP